jgi:hypothetical protein
MKLIISVVRRFFPDVFLSSIKRTRSLNFIHIYSSSSSFSAVHHPLLDECLSNPLPFLSVSTHSSQFIRPSSTRSTLLYFTSNTIPVFLASICHPFFSLCCPLHLFHTYLPSWSFLLRSLLVIPIHLSTLLCVHWILCNITEFSIRGSHPSFFCKHSGVLDLKTMFILPKALHPM